MGIPHKASELADVLAGVIYNSDAAFDLSHNEYVSAEETSSPLPGVIVRFRNSDQDEHEFLLMVIKIEDD